jgi:hypothetical protein
VPDTVLGARRLWVRRGLAGSVVVVFAGAVAVSACTSKSAGSSSAVQPASTRVVATPGAQVTVHRHQTLHVALPSSAQTTGVSTSYALTAMSGPQVLVPVPGAPGSFTADVDGTAQVDVSQSPICASGVACAAHIVEVATVMVTVTG